MRRGGWIDTPPIFICENNRKSDKIMHCVDFFCVVVLKILAFFYVFIYLSVMGRYNPPFPSTTKLKYVKNAHISKTTTQKKDQHSA